MVELRPVRTALEIANTFDGRSQLWQAVPLLAFAMTGKLHQGAGLARYCIERSIDALHARGYTDVRLVVTEGNLGAIRLYRKLGFHTVS